METNELLREYIFEIIETQLRSNDPPEAKMAYDRLIKKGFGDFETKQRIGQCHKIFKELFSLSSDQCSKKRVRSSN